MLLFVKFTDLDWCCPCPCRCCYCSWSLVSNFVMARARHRWNARKQNILLAAHLIDSLADILTHSFNHVECEYPRLFAAYKFDKRFFFPRSLWIIKTHFSIIVLFLFCQSPASSVQLCFSIFYSCFALIRFLFLFFLIEWNLAFDFFFSFSDKLIFRRNWFRMAE